MAAIVLGRADTRQHMLVLLYVVFVCTEYSVCKLLCPADSNSPLYMAKNKQPNKQTKKKKKKNFLGFFVIIP